MASEIITTIIVIVMFVGIIAWVFLMAVWMLGKFGLWKWATYRKLKKRFKDADFNEDALEWCLDKIEKKWRYKDVRRFVKYENDAGELLYTFISLTKLNKKELTEIIERRLKNNEQQIRRTEEKVGRTLPKIPKERDFGGSGF